MGYFQIMQIGINMHMFASDAVNLLIKCPAH